MKIYVYSSKFYTLLFFTLLSFSVRAQNLHIFASPNGSATGDGTNESAPVSLTQAKAIVRAHPSQPCIIYLEAGTYPAFSLDATDSRSGSAPAVYVARQQNSVIFQPEAPLNRASFQPIPANIQARIIDPTAKTKVMQIPLATLGFTDTAQWPADFQIGELKSPKFYKDGIPLPMSRYPAANTTMAMRQVINKGSYRSVPGGSFKYRDDRARYWLNAVNDGGVWLSGNWQSQFQLEVVKTQSISTIDSLITQSIGIWGGLGAAPYGRLVPGQEPYYALNLVEEIAAEGQWSINFKTKMLYMWVPASGTLACAGNSKMPGISVNGVNNTQFINLAVRGGSGNGIELYNCNNVQILANHISLCSGNGVTITGGSNCTVQSCDIDSVGAGGVIISSINFTTDQFNVTLSNHKVINNHIYSYAREAFLYSGAVNTQNAVGSYVAYNKIHDCPHVGILYGGNSNVIEYNEVYDVVKQYSDMGVFYKVEMGQLWLSRGNKLNHNYIHDAVKANGFYNDNFSSGDSIIYNVVERVSMGLFDHQGYFTAYANNVCVNNVYPVTTMVEPITGSAYPTHYNSLKTIWNNSPAYRAAYPECADMVGSVVRNESYTSRIWPSVTGCVFTANSGIFSNSNIDMLFNKDGTTNALYAQTSNVFTTWATRFQNNFRLGYRTNPILPFTLDSLKILGAFGHTGGLDWHLNRIGLHKDQYRADITGLTIPGADPAMKLRDSSNANFKTPGTVFLILGIKFPNAANVISSTYWLDNGKPIAGLTITKKSVTYDSVSYIAQWTNPPTGSHSIQVEGKDGAYWVYYSNTVGFSITAATAAAATDTVAKKATANKFAASADSTAVPATAFSLFPNPAASVINITYSPATAQINSNIVIYDMLGRIALKKTADFQAGPNMLTLPLGNLLDGTYLIVLQTPHSAAISRTFVIKH